jgi:chorismate mutase
MTAENALRITHDHLTTLREQIDRVDHALHDLIQQRTEIVLQIREDKLLHNTDGTTTIMRPAREATIMRDLVARHRGNFPAISLLRIWREMIGALSQLQGSFRLGAWVPNDSQGLWDTARDHFGVSVPLTALPTPQAVVRAVGDNSIEIGMVPVPNNDGDQKPWWTMLIHQDLKQIHIVGQLPFLITPGQPPRAWLISRQNPEPTGMDESLMVVTTPQQISRDGLTQLLTILQRPFRIIGPAVPGAVQTMMYLVAIDGFIDNQHPELAEIIANAENRIESLYILGSYACPIVIEEKTP